MVCHELTALVLKITGLVWAYGPALILSPVVVSVRQFNKQTQTDVSQNYNLLLCLSLNAPDTFELSKTSIHSHLVYSKHLITNVEILPQLVIEVCKRI